MRELGNDHAELMRLAFGESDDHSETSGSGNSDGREPAEAEAEGWQRYDAPSILTHSEVPGLHQVKRFLEPEAQRRIVDSMRELGWLENPTQLNQAMQFGGLPSWLQEVADNMLPYLSKLWPEELSGRHPLFDQLIMNAYEPGDGICSHVDLLRFQDGIANLSFLSTCVMAFQKAEQCDCLTLEEGSQGCRQQTQVLLEPGDLLLLQGDARYKWEHGIQACTSEPWGEDTIVRSLRVSITLRRLVIAERSSHAESGPVPCQAHTEADG
mmetsp:Transcript_10685/g.30373  ORF Transcript_10685/g.30373 Transcript_10685/m.30373 type:complete len:268 (-) Transcript_10685:278-1081(-)